MLLRILSKNSHFVFALIVTISLSGQNKEDEAITDSIRLETQPVEPQNTSSNLINENFEPEKKDNTKSEKVSIRKKKMRGDYSLNPSNSASIYPKSQFDINPERKYDSYFKNKWLKNRLHISLGGTLSSNFMDQQDKVSTLGGALGGGAAFEEFSRWNATENRISGANPTQDQGGCPDIPGVSQATPVDFGEGRVLPAQIFTVQGLSCSTGRTEGNSLTLLGPEIQLLVHYDIFDWLSFTTGFQMAFIMPARFIGEFNYLGNSEDIQITGLTDPITGDPINNIGAFITINSAAIVEFSATSIEIPLMFEYNFYKNAKTEIYLGFGMIFSLASLTNRVSAVQNIIINANNENFSLGNTNYKDVENTRSLASFNLGLSIGARRYLSERLGVFLEFKWSKGGGPVTISGTQKQAGVDYASDTFAAQVMNTISEGSVAQPLRSDAEPRGARTVDGLVPGYAARFMLGAIYSL